VLAVMAARVKTRLLVEAAAVLVDIQARGAEVAMAV
jgi:hypothetical protein